MKSLRLAFVFVLLVGLFMAGTLVGLVRVQEAGHGNRLISVLISLGDLAREPGVRLVGDGGDYKHNITLQSGLRIYGVDFLLYLAVGYLLGRYWLRTRGGDPFVRPLSRGRRNFLRFSGGAAAGAVLWTTGAEPYRLEVTQVQPKIPRLPAELQGLRMVQLTDIHHGPWLSLSRVREVVEIANDLRPDLILLTGDYVHQSPAYIEPMARELGRLRAPVGVFAVLGNHDWREDGPLTQRELVRAGITLLDNTRRIITPDRKVVREAKEGLCLAGVGDLIEHYQDYRAALGGLPEEMPRLLLSHNPDAAEILPLHRTAPRVDLMISGHTHGGQVWIPGLGTPVLPSDYGQKYASGLVQGPVCPVYVSRGIGMTNLPVRFGVPPEIPVIELHRA